KPRSKRMNARAQASSTARGDTGLAFGGRGGDGFSTKPSTRGPAEVIPFPIMRRVAFLERMADFVAACPNLAAYLPHFSHQPSKAMRRRGLSEEAIESEIASFEREIMWRLG